MSPILDNEGNAILRDDGTPDTRISCQETQAAGGCPVLLDTTRPSDGAVLGIFGTDCWYRGKYGAGLMEALGLDDNEIYNDLSPSECDDLAGALESALEYWLERHNGTANFWGDGDVQNDVRYFIWWLRFVAREANGCNAWY